MMPATIMEQLEKFLASDHIRDRLFEAYFSEYRYELCYDLDANEFFIDDGIVVFGWVPSLAKIPADHMVFAVCLLNGPKIDIEELYELQGDKEYFNTHYAEYIDSIGNQLQSKIPQIIDHYRLFPRKK